MVFNLIENVPIEPDNLPVPTTDISLKPEPPDIPEEGQTEGRHAVITCTFLIVMFLLCLLYLCMPTIYEKQFSGEKIMSQLTGFGQPHMSQHFSPMESGLSHQQNIHHLLHQEAQSIHHHQQQQQAALHQHRMAQASSVGEFMNQPGGVPCVKIVEQPAGNKLRFRLVVTFCNLFFNFRDFNSYVF